ncbi:hypothetical protein GN956_G327 [Arapaima gigas]
MDVLIQNLRKPLQTSVDTLCQTVNAFKSQLTSAETLQENFDRLTTAKASIKHLQAQITSLLDYQDNVDNISHQANLCIINVPEGSEYCQHPIKFLSKMMLEVMGTELFEKPLELERVHCALGLKPVQGKTREQLSHVSTDFRKKNGLCPGYELKCRGPECSTGQEMHCI